MALTIYKEEDIMLMVVYVLNFCACYYYCNAFKFAVKDYYPDLKGLVTTDHADESMVELVNAVPEDDELFVLMLESISLISSASEKISNLYLIDIRKSINDDPLSDLAEVFYFETSADNFPLDGEGDHYDDMDYFICLDVYTNSLVNVINWLFILVIEEQADTELGYADLDFLDRDYFHHSHAFALDILRELSVHLTEKHVAIEEYTYR